MTVLMERPQDVDDSGAIEEYFEALEVPPGFKAELIEGAIVVTPPPGEEHEDYFAEATHHFNTHGWRVSGNAGLAAPGGKFVPDLTVARREFFGRRTGENWRDPEGVALVVEITSSYPEKDRVGKRLGYAAAGIPLYLLIDRQRKEITLFSTPERGDYRGTLTLPIDEPIPLPEPFSFTLADLV